MEEKKEQIKKIKWADWGIGLYLIGYGVFSYGFLTDYPFVHSDESWLAGLSRDMLHAGSLGVTESFFDAKIRYPHAVKSLFHLLQIGFIRIFGYSAESVRLLSLAGGLLLLIAFYLLIKRVTGKEKTALAVTVIFSLDTEFIYASHFARQEIWIGLFLTLGLLYLLAENSKWKKAVSAAVITGVSIGFHPNSFLLACCFGGILLFEMVCEIICEKKKEIGPLFLYIGITGLFASLFVAASYAFDSQFLSHYFKNGANEFGIDASVISKIGELGGFFQRLFQKQSGTYYITELRFSLLFFAFLACFLGIYALAMKEKQIGSVLAGAAGLIGGMVLIGRYNQTSIFFLYPLGYLFFGIFLSKLEQTGQTAILAGVLGITCFISAGEIRPWLKEPGYEAYLSQLQNAVPRKAMVIANLNTEFYFEAGYLRDYRNLPYAQESGLEKYLEKNRIEYILYSTELDYLYEHRPYFNVIYGNTQFVPELKQFCEEKGEKVAEFVNRQYGNRVISILGQEEYSRIIVYKINAPAS